MFGLLWGRDLVQLLLFGNLVCLVGFPVFE